MVGIVQFPNRINKFNNNSIIVPSYIYHTKYALLSSNEVILYIQNYILTPQVYKKLTSGPLSSFGRDFVLVLINRGNLVPNKKCGKKLKK